MWRWTSASSAPVVESVGVVVSLPDAEESDVADEDVVVWSLLSEGVAQATRADIVKAARIRQIIFFIFASEKNIHYYYIIILLPFQ